MICGSVGGYGSVPNASPNGHCPWPNCIAPSAWTLAAITVSHVKRTAQAERHHQEMKDHMTAIGAAVRPETTTRS